MIASVVPAPKQESLTPIEVLIETVLLAANDDAPADVRQLGQLVSDGLLQLALAAGFPEADRDTLLQAIAHRDYDEGNDLAEAALGILQEHNWIQGDELEDQPGRPTTRYYINPGIRKVLS